MSNISNATIVAHIFVHRVLFFTVELVTAILNVEYYRTRAVGITMLTGRRDSYTATLRKHSQETGVTSSVIIQYTGRY